MIINDGDIIIVEQQVFDRSLSDSKHIFLRLRFAWRVDSITNNGSIKAHDHKGQRHYIHAMDKPGHVAYIVKTISK